MNCKFASAVALDIHLIANVNEYGVLVHQKLKDYKPGWGNRQYENREIYLPANEKFIPSLCILPGHRKKSGYNKSSFYNFPQYFPALRKRLRVAFSIDFPAFL